MAFDLACEFGEGRDAAAAGPGQPAVQSGDGGRGALGLRDPVDRTQALLEEVGPVQARVVGRDPGELGALPLGQVLRVLPQRVPCNASDFRARSGSAAWRRARFQLARRLLVQRLGGPGDDVEGVHGPHGVRGPLGGHVAIHSAPSALMCVSRWARSSPRASKKVRRTSLPGVCHHTRCRLSWSTTTVMYSAPCGRRSRRCRSCAVPRGGPGRRPRRAGSGPAIAPTVRQAVRISWAVADLDTRWPARRPARRSRGVPGVVPGPGHRGDHYAVPAAGHARGIGLQVELEPGGVQVPPPPASGPGRKLST